MFAIRIFIRQLRSQDVIIAPAIPVIVKGTQNPTIGHCVTGAGGNHPIEFPPQSLQPLNTGRDVGNPGAGKNIHLPARPVGMITQRQQIAHRINGKPQVPGMADEQQTIHMGLGIKPLVSIRAFRCGQQADLLIIPDGLNFAARLPGHAADRGFYTHFLLEAPVTRGISVAANDITPKLWRTNWPVADVHKE